MTNPMSRRATTLDSRLFGIMIYPYEAEENAKHAGRGDASYNEGRRDARSARPPAEGEEKRVEARGMVTGKVPGLKLTGKRYASGAGQLRIGRMTWGQRTGKPSPTVSFKPGTRPVGRKTPMSTRREFSSDRPLRARSSILPSRPVGGRQCDKERTDLLDGTRNRRVQIGERLGLHIGQIAPRFEFRARSVAAPA